MRRMEIGILLAVILTACGEGSSRTNEPNSPPRVLRGTFDATGDCIAEQQGYEIVVTDEDGSVIATGESVPDTKPRDGQCLSTFGLEVPDADFYSIRIGIHDGPTWSKADLQAVGWSVELSL